MCVDPLHRRDVTGILGFPTTDFTLPFTTTLQNGPLQQIDVTAPSGELAHRRGHRAR